MVFMHRDEDETKFNIGQITSLAVFRTYRRLGLAEKLMRQSRIELCVSSWCKIEKMMITLYNCKYCNLHVRESNYAALHLYKDVLHFQYMLTFQWRSHSLEEVDVKYYADQENGLSMRHDLAEYAKELNMEPYQPHHIDPSLDQPSKAEAAPETVEEPKSDLLAEDNNKPEKKEKAPAKKGKQTKKKNGKK